MTRPKWTLCCIPQCMRLSKLWGMCSMHAQRQARHGDPMVTLLVRKPAPREPRSAS